MSSEMNLAEFPLEVLLEIFRKIGHDDTQPLPLRTTLRLVCRRFNNIICDPNNKRRVSAIRMKVNKITIAQFGSALAFRIFHGTDFEDRASNRELIFCFPEIPILKSGKGNLVLWKWEALTNCQKNRSCEGSKEFFEKFTHIISQFETDEIEFARIEITRSFLSSLIECLEGYPRVRSVNFDVLYKGYNTNLQKTQFEENVDVGIMAKLTSKFRVVTHFPKQFVTSELIEEWISGPGTEDLFFFGPIEENEAFTPISLRYFSRFYIFHCRKLVTTLAELISAVEQRIMIRAFDWELSMVEEEKEIRKFMQKNNLKYQVVDRFSQNDTLDGLKLMKFHKLNGADHVVRINFRWTHEVRCYRAICTNHVVK